MTIDEVKELLKQIEEHPKALSDDYLNEVGSETRKVNSSMGDWLYGIILVRDDIVIDALKSCLTEIERLQKCQC